MMIVNIQGAGAVQVIVEENSAERIVIRFQLGEYGFSETEIAGTTYVEPILDDRINQTETGRPCLPRLARSVIIPNNARMELRLLESRYHELSDVDILPGRGPLPRTVAPAEVPYHFGPVYGKNEFHPGRLAGLGQPYIMRDHRGVVLQVHPFQYNPGDRVLRVHTMIRLALVAAGPGQVNVLEQGKPLRRLSRAFHELYRAQFINYDLDRSYDPLDEEGELLIICHDPWLSSVQALAEHKNSIGIDTTVTAVSAIGNSAAAIKNYIQSVYDSSDLAFVLLVGDVLQLATPIAAGGAADPTYAKLAGSDDYPEVMVGRFSAESQAELETQVQRTIWYELLPASGEDWFWRGMGVGYDEGYMDQLRDQLLDCGYSEVDRIYDPWATVEMVTDGLHAGRGIINYCGQGSAQSWGVSGFSVSDVQALANTERLPFIFSVASLNGRFDSGTCLAEAWLRAENGGQPSGAVAAYMSSSVQYWIEPLEAQREFVQLYCSGSYHGLGTLCYAGSCAMMDLYGATGAATFNCWIFFGDPSLRVVGSVLPATLSVQLGCTPSSATLPFECRISVGLANLMEKQSRRVAAQIDLVTAGGSSMTSYRAGFTNLSGGEIFNTAWNQTVPGIPSLVGPNIFTLIAEDVTPAPFNQPPYSPSGFTDTETCTVIGLVP